MKIFIVIPAYNEANRIGDTLHAFYTNFNPNFEFRIIVVSDGSSDETDSIVRDFEREKGVVLVTYAQNRGKGYALQQGVNKALELAEAENLDSENNYVYICDADLSTPATEIISFVNTLNSANYDVVIGSRAVPGAREHGGQLRKLMGKVGNRLINLALDLQLNDTQCGFKLFNLKSAQYFKKLTVFRWGFDFELLYLLKRDGYKIAELPVKWVAENKYSTFKPSGYLTTLLDLYKVWWRHVRFSKSFFLSVWRQYGRIARYAIIGFGTVFIDLGIFALLESLDAFQAINISLASVPGLEAYEITIPNYALWQPPAIIVSTIFNFIGHKLWTFSAQKFSVAEVGRYILAVVFNGVAQMAILYFSVEFFSLPEILGKIIAIAVVVSWNFFLLKLVVYKVN